MFDDNKHSNRFWIGRVIIKVNEDLLPHQMKAVGYVNSLGQEIIQELEVDKLVYERLKSEYGI